jgi:hypothetical protein
VTDDSATGEPMPLPTRPFLVIYVAWHPAFDDGARLAKVLFDHYRRKLYENVSGGSGLPVVYRSAPPTGSVVPIDVDFAEAETSAIVMLIDDHWAADPDWVAWGRQLMDSTDKVGLGTRVFPVAISPAATAVGMAEQAVRWDKWEAVAGLREHRLITTLTHQFCRMLRSYLERLKHPAAEEDELLGYLKKVEIFLSHSKHDADGERIAKLIRAALSDGEGLDSFFDLYDIPAGLRFNKVILQKVKVSAVVAIHTDSYSSREWCRREIIEAKRWHVPLVVTNCLSELDERTFPYMGNVPVVRMDPIVADRIALVIGRLLDEVLKDFLWRCWVQLVSDAATDVVFLPRPPELISLTALVERGDTATTLVYPDPPIGAEEQRLFEIVAPKVRLRSVTEWLAGDSL